MKLCTCHYRITAYTLGLASVTIAQFLTLTLQNKRSRYFTHALSSPNSHNRQSSSPPLSPVTSLIDAYSPTSVLSSPATVPLGTTVVLVCRVGGVASGTQLSYTWTCPNGPCDVGEGNNPNRKTYGDRMVLNVLTSRDGGTYTCLVTNTDKEDAIHRPSFTIYVQGVIYFTIIICKHVCNSIHISYTPLRRWGCPQ